MHPVVFHALTRDCDLRGVEVDLAPQQPADLLSTATSQDHQSDDVGIIATDAIERLPHGA
jgi:hypothetical protein